MNWVFIILLIAAWVGCAALTWRNGRQARKPEDPPGRTMTLGEILHVVNVTYQAEKQREETLVGHPISREEAIELARQALKDAERARREYVDREAERGVQYGNREWWG